MGIQINGQTDTISAVDGSFNLAGTVVANSGTVTVGTGATVHSPATNVLTLGTNSVERVRITSTGNVGVSTIPKDWESGQFFAVQVGSGGAIFGRAGGDEDRNGFISNCYHDAGGWKYIASSAHATRYEQNDGNHLWYYAGTGTKDASIAFTEVLRINTSGNVGIGTNTPRSRLDVFETTTGNQTAIRIGNTNTPSSANDKRLEFVDGTGTTEGTNKFTFGYVQGYREGGSNSGALIFGTKPDNASAPSERLRITSSGNIGIGTNNPSKPLQVHSDSASAVLVTGATPQIRFNSNVGDGTDADRVILGRASGNDQFITGSVDGDAILRCATSKKVMIGYGTTEIAQFNSSGLKFKTSGMGIDFSATSDAGGMTSELFDDYEEGTWTPTITSGGHNIANSYNNTYIKVGRQVTVWAFFGLGNNGGNANYLGIGGLPYTVLSNGYSTGVVDFGNGGVKGNYARADNNSTEVIFLYPSENISVSRSVLQGNQVGTTAYVIFCITYNT